MRFLRILGLGLIDARFFGQITAVEAVRDGFARGGNRAVIHLYTVGPHVSDSTVFVEALRHAHRVAGGESELASGFLLQRRRGERRLRIARHRLGFDAVDAEITSLDCKPRSFRIGLGLQVHFVELLAQMAR